MGYLKDITNSNTMELLKLMEQPYHFTYILLGSDNTYYTGITNNITRRLTEHQEGRSKSTRRKLPVKLIYLKGLSERKDSRTLEVKIKLRGAQRYLNNYMFKGKEVAQREWIDKTAITQKLQKH